MKTVLRYIVLGLFIAIIMNSVALSEQFGTESLITIAQTIAILIAKEAALVAGMIGFLFVCWWLIPGHEDDF